MERVCCAACGGDLHLHPQNRFPPMMYFDAGQAKSVSYAAADEGVLRLEEEERMGCFFDTCSSWGIHRIQTLLFCKECGAKLGVVLQDGPAENGSRGQMGFGPSQMLARVKRYRFWSKNIIITPLEQAEKS